MSITGFKTIDEQIDILGGRGLAIPDRKAAYDFLLHNNYYRVSGYSLTLRTNDVFHIGASFDDIVKIYECDTEMRNILFGGLESIETSFKSIYAYESARIHGEFGYINASHFTDSRLHSDILEHAKSQMMSRLPHELYIRHYKNDLKKDMPIWAYVDLFTISNISQLYSISSDAVRSAVTSHYSFPSVKLLDNFMHSMTILRNLCAHGSRIYNRMFSQRPRLSKIEQSYLIKSSDGQIDNTKLYSYIFVMKRLLDANEFGNMKRRLMSLPQQYPSVDMSCYGFRNDWKDVL